MQLPNGSVWPCRRTKKEKQDWRSHGDGRKKKSKTGEDGSYHIAQIGLGNRGRKKSKKWIGFDLDLIWIEIGVLKRNEPAHPVMGTIFLVIVLTGSSCLTTIKKDKAKLHVAFI